MITLSQGRGLFGLLLASAGVVQASTSTAYKRHTLDFGATLESHAHYGAAHALHPSIAAFHSSQPESASTPSGEDVAAAFVKHLHPQTQFKVQSQFVSAHNGVLHTHFIQQVYDPLTGKHQEVVNGLVNVNVDTATGDVISYGDSAWRGRQHCQTTNTHIQQVFLGSKETCQRVHTGAEPEPDYTLVDPRLALASFLRIGNPSLGLLSQPIDTIIESMVSQHSESSDDDTLVTINEVPGAVESVPMRLAFLQTDPVVQGGEADLQLVWSLEYQSNDNWYEAHVQALSKSTAEEEPTPLFVADWIKDAKHHDQLVPKYRVFKWGINDPTEGNRSTEVDPHDKTASPVGWQVIPPSNSHPSYAVSKHWLYESGWSDHLNAGRGANMTDTRGNNVFAQDNPSGGNLFELNHRPQTSDLNFSFPLGWKCHESVGDCEGKDIPPESYINASITQLFYTVNAYHDLVYRYGFDEVAGNFQQHNFGKGGAEQDPIIANAQDGSGWNNANFATPPDGRSGKMRMYKWNGRIPFRDGDLEAGIVEHEASHGLSIRLTGGPANSGCLGWGEAGGMGEGYGDFIATLIRMHKKKPKDWDMGRWASGMPDGIRKWKYSTNSTTNPFHYKDVDKMWEVHSTGAVWAEFLFVMTEDLIAKHGFSHELFPPAPIDDNSTPSEVEAHRHFYNTSSVTGKHYPAQGNTLGLQLVIDGMKLQPCRPNFLSARDAILAADHALTGGSNYCIILNSFTKRGAGIKAAVRGSTPWGGGFREEDYELPHKCKKSLA